MVRPPPAGRECDFGVFNEPDVVEPGIPRGKHGGGCVAISRMSDSRQSQQVREKGDWRGSTLKSRVQVPTFKDLAPTRLKPRFQVSFPGLFVVCFHVQPETDHLGCHLGEPA